MENPTWGYRLVDGKVESKIFDGKLPRGWKDTPADLKAPKKSDDYDA